MKFKCLAASKRVNCGCFVFEMNHETNILTGEQNSSNAGFTKYMY